MSIVLQQGVEKADPAKIGGIAVGLERAAMHARGQKVLAKREY
jgi:hypothetical protein